MISHRYTDQVLFCINNIINKHHSVTLLNSLCSLFSDHIIWEVSASNKTQALHNRESTYYEKNIYTHCQWEDHRLS